MLPEGVGTTGAAGEFEQTELVADCAGRPVCRPFVEPAFERLDFELGHDAPLYAGGSATLSVTDDCRGQGGDETTMELWVPFCSAILLIRRKCFGTRSGLTKPVGRIGAERVRAKRGPWIHPGYSFAASRSTGSRVKLQRHAPLGAGPRCAIAHRGIHAHDCGYGFRARAEPVIGRRRAPTRWRTRHDERTSSAIGQ